MQDMGQFHEGFDDIASQARDDMGRGARYGKRKRVPGEH
jgi:hypothetical protein